VIFNFATNQFADFCAFVRRAGIATGVFYFIHPTTGDSDVFALIHDGRNVARLDGTSGTLTQAVILAQFPDAIQVNARPMIEAVPFQV
jgi:hypothetical protein